MICCLERGDGDYMAFSIMFDSFVNFYREHPPISLALLLILVYLLVRKPKTFLLIVSIAAVFTGVLYFWMFLSAEKNNLIWK
jgi:hypothetical protein